MPEWPLEEILQAITKLHSSDTSNDERRSAEALLIKSYELPDIDSLAIDVIKHVLPPTIDIEVAETIRFLGLQLLQEGVKLRWKEWDVLRRNRIKEAVLALVGDQLLKSHLTQQKLASLIAFIASLDWPDQWPGLLEVFLWKAKEKPLESSAVFLGVIQHLCNDSQTPQEGIESRISVNRRREILQALEKLTLDIVVIMKVATDFIATHGCEKNKEIVELACLALEASNALASSVSVVSLLSEKVDEFILSVLSKFPECHTAALNLMTTLAISLGKKKNRQQPAISIPLEDLKRFTELITRLTEVCCVFEKAFEKTTLQSQVQVANIVKDFLEKSSDPLIQRLPSETLQYLWQNGVWKLISHPALSIATIGITSSGFIINRLCTLSSDSLASVVPEWVNIKAYIGLLYWRCFRVGDPSLTKYIDILSQQWCSSPYHGWPVDEIIKTFRELVNANKVDHSCSWWSLSSTMALSEGRAELGEDDDFVDEEAQTTIQNSSTGVSGSFGSRYASLKSSVSIPLVTLWMYSSQTRYDIISVSQYFGSIIINSSCVQDTTTFDPLRTLPSVMYQTERIADRLKPWMSPCYVLLDGLYLPIEAIAQKIKTDLIKSGIQMDVANEEWVKVAITVFDSIISLEFPQTTMAHFLEIRRLDFLGTCATFLSGIGFDLSKILDLVFCKIFLPGAEDASAITPAAVLVNGTVENWHDQAYLIRRRALYALIHLCQGSLSQSLAPYLERIVLQVQGRLNSTVLHDTEKALLIESVMSAAAATQSYAIQERFARQLTQFHVETILSAKFKSLTDEQGNLIELLYGQPSSITDPTLAEELAENRRAISRLVGQVESILKRALIPKEQSILESGGYLNQCSRDGHSRVDLTSMIHQDQDISPYLSFYLKHPLHQLVSQIFIPLLQFTSTFQLLWTKQTLSQHPWLEPLLAIGEEEWKALEGGTPLYSGNAIKLKVVVGYTFPYPSSMIADKVYLTRRHGFHIRRLLYRCLGEMSDVTSAFYGQPRIQLLLRNFIIESIEKLSVCHLGVQLEHLWRRVMSEKNMTELLTSNYPVLGFLQVTLVPLLKETAARLEREMAELDVIRRRLSKNSSTVEGKEENFQRRMSLYTLRYYAATGCASNILEIVSGLFHVKGTSVIRSDPSNDGKNTSTDVHRVVSTTQQQNLSSITSSIGLISPDSDDEIPSIQKLKSFPMDLKTMELKQKLFGDEIIMTTVLSTCVKFLLFPNVQVINEAYRILRAYIKQATKNFSPLHSCTQRFTVAIYQSSLNAIFEPPLFDPLVLSDINMEKSDDYCTPLQEFVSGKDPTNCLSNQIVSNLYEALRGLYRYHCTLCCTIQKSPEDPHNIILCPPLYDALLSLLKLPVPISSEDLEAFTGKLVCRKESHDSKSCKDMLRQIVKLNLRPSSETTSWQRRDFTQSVLSTKTKTLCTSEISDDWEEGAALDFLFS